jgi:hypothetical protein
MNLKSLHAVSKAIEVGEVPSGWRLARLWRVRSSGESSLYWLILSAISSPHVVQLVVSASCGRNSVRRATLSSGTKVLALTEVI